jgi:hypothetical protein
MQALMESRYAELEAVLKTDELHLVNADAGAQQFEDALRACYDGSTKRLRSLKRDILRGQPKRTLKYCPMCGTTLAATFDHYLPASEFPEFAVHALNLIPCCSTCNTTKGDGWLTSGGSRQYIHALLDDVPNAEFLRASLVEQPGCLGVGATFSLERPAGCSSAKWTLVESHFGRLRLLDRYRDLSNDEIAEMLASCRSFLSAGGSDYRSFLTGQASDWKQTYGRNHWRAVLAEVMTVSNRLDVWIASAVELAIAGG